MMYRTAVAAIVSIAAFSVYGQVEVIDRSVPTSRSSTAPPSADANAQLYYQLQVLQQEIQELRGMVEEQGFELKKLKQQRLDDYLDLDRRLSQKAQSGSSTVSSGSSISRASGDASPSIVTARPDEMKQYKAAMNLVLREQKYDDAITALTQYLEDYPNGRFAANSQYWLGEVYLQKSQLEQARQWFTRVISEFPDSSKAPDAKYKLGIVHHKLGDKAKAKTLLESVAESNANAARLAKEYLEANSL